MTSWDQYDDAGEADLGGGAALPVPVDPGGIMMQSSVGDIVKIRRAAIAMKRVTAEVRETIRHMAELVAETGQHGSDTWQYRFPVKNKRTGRTEWIEGPTIKCANAVARAYGNCSADVTRVEENDRSYFIYATFIDYQTGYQTTRVFRQRKGQTTMGNDAERGEDITFQIGVSKSVRNVINNALGDLVEYALDRKHHRMAARIGEKREHYIERIKERCVEIDYSILIIEKWAGRGKADDWPVSVIAQVMQILSAHAEGVLRNLDDVFAPGASQVEAKEAVALDDDGGEGGKPAAEQKPADQKPQEPGKAQATGKKAAPPKAGKEAKPGSKPADAPKAEAPKATAPAETKAPQAQASPPQPGDPKVVATVFGRPMPSWAETHQAAERVLQEIEESGNWPVEIGSPAAIREELDRVIDLLERRKAELAAPLRQRLNALPAQPAAAETDDGYGDDTTGDDHDGEPQAGEPEPQQAPEPEGPVYEVRDKTGGILATSPLAGPAFLDALNVLADAENGKFSELMRVKFRNQDSLDRLAQDIAQDAAMMQRLNDLLDRFKKK